MVDLASPGDVGDMDHAVQTIFQFNKGAVAGEVTNLTLDLATGRILDENLIPRVGLELTDT